MKNNSKSLTSSSLKLGVIVFLVAAIGGLAVYFYGHTLIVWWLPVFVGVLSAIFAGGVVLMRWDRGGNNFPWIKFLVSSVLAGVSIPSLFLGGNYLMADKESEHEEQVQIVKKYSKERHRTRRVGRRYVADNNQTYHVYYFMVMFPDGREKEMEVATGRYINAKVGDTFTLTCSKGFLGFPVFR